jgi:DnaJ-class molecular chaperone
MTSDARDHYTILGLDRGCTEAEIRQAYRLLTKRHHPDVNGGSEDAQRRSQELNAAYETLSDRARRKAYDEEIGNTTPRSVPRGKPQRNVTQDARVRLVDFLHGTTLEVRVDDPGNPAGPETYQLEVPPNTAPGSRLRIARDSGGFVQIRLKPMPGGRLKVKGSDLQCDLRISAQRAKEGGREMTMGLTGRPVLVSVPRGVARGEILRVPNEGLPKPHGGRGDLLARVTYQPTIRVSRARGS